MSSTLSVIYSGGFNLGVMKHQFNNVSDCRCHLKRLQTELIVKDGYKKVAYGESRSSSDVGAVMLKKIVVEVL